MADEIKTVRFKDVRPGQKFFQPQLPSLILVRAWDSEGQTASDTEAVPADGQSAITYTLGPNKEVVLVG